MDLITIHPELESSYSDAETSQQSSEYFANNFWGEKNLGFNVLHHNMKHRQTSIKELQDFIRESASAEELYAKQVMKLAKQAANCSQIGTFYPLMDVFRVMNEKISSCHMDIVLKLQDIIKELQKYYDEQKNQHKQHKDMFNSTSESLHNLQVATGLVSKTKEKYYQISMEEDRMKACGTAQSRDLDRLSVKSKKAAEDYKGNVGKHAVARHQFEEKMYRTACEFQRLEKDYLDHMKSVMDTCILSFENSQVLINQVHQEFRRQLEEKTSESLLLQYTEQKGTGTTRPKTIVFEEFKPDSLNSGAVTPTSVENGNQNSSLSDSSLQSIPLPSTKVKKEASSGLFGIRRRKVKQKNDFGNHSTSSKDSKDAESIESPEKVRNNYMVDEEGYTIRPDSPERSDKSSFKYSSDSDSDSDSDAASKKMFQVKIKPKEAVTVNSGDDNIETLNAITKTFTIGSPSFRSKKLGSSSDARRVRNRSPSTFSSSEKVASPDLMLARSDSAAVESGSTEKSMTGDESLNGQDLFKNFKANKLTKTMSSKEKRPSIKKGPAPPIPSEISDSAKDLDDLLGLTRSEIIGSHPFVNADKPPPRPPKPNTSDISFLSMAPADLSPRHSPSLLVSSESWCSLSSSSSSTTPNNSANDSTPLPSFASISRGPSPLTLSSTDNIPIAVAFIETVNAYFKGGDDSKTLTKITGQVQISFPAGIMRAFTSNSSPPTLSFRIFAGSSDALSSLTHNTSILHSTGRDGDSFAFSFHMPALVDHLKKMAEKSPNSPHYNIHIISYLVPSSHSMLPLYLSCSWKCNPDVTNIDINYSYNSSRVSSPLQTVNFLVPVNGSVVQLHSTPDGTWNSSHNRLIWRIPSKICKESATGSLSSSLNLAAGPSTPSPFAVQFVSEGATFSCAELELVGDGYRVSLIKKRFISGKYLCENS